MSSLTRSVRRAPARIIASIMAIALAVGAIGVFAVPNVAAESLRELALDDHIAHVAADTTPFASVDQLDLDGVEVVEGRVSRSVATPQGLVRVIGIDFPSQTINIVEPDLGELPGLGQALVSEGLAEIGETVILADTPLEVVGIGNTTWWAVDDVVYTQLADAQAITGVDGVNRVLIRMVDTRSDSLDTAVEDLRHALNTSGSRLESFPITVPDGRHPIEEELTQISTMIGLLGVVAGIVALTLLASTTNTLITERTREVAIMRSLGGVRRPLRRRLRGLALGIAGAGALIGIPLGILVANVVARVVLTRFTGITPAIAVSWTVMGASLAFALIGARLVAGRAARRVTRTPLAEALRDREGSPFGGRWSDRVLARIPTGGLFERMALRAGAHRRARTVGVMVQLTAGVAAVVTVASLGTSIAAFDEAELEPWNWQSSAQAVDAGLPFDAALADNDDSIEAAIVEVGQVGDWDVLVFGLSPDTIMLDNDVREGRWLDGSRGVVVSAGFAAAQGIDVGSDVDISLASGVERYRVQGLHRSRSLDFYIPIDVLAADLGAEGQANTFWTTGSHEEIGMVLPAAADLITIEELHAEGAEARAVIAKIFWVIGLIIVGVSVLGVSSAMAVNLYERRHELAAFQAIGGSKAQMRRVLMTELVPQALVASAVGAVAGWYGSIAIIGFFESVNAVEIGTVFATSMVPLATAAAVGVVALIAATAARRAAKRPVAVVLRGAA